MIQYMDRTAVSIGLATIVLLAMTLGGAAMPVAAQEGVDTSSTEITVAEDGSLEKVEITAGLDEEMYDEFATRAESEGYDSVEEWEESFYEDEPWSDDFSVTVTEIQGGYEYSLVLLNVETDELPVLDVSTAEDSITYEEWNVQNPDNDPSISESTYRVNMPGEITDSNAHEVHDNVAVWHLHDDHTSEVFVEASLQAEDDVELEVDDESDSDEEDDSDAENDGDDGDDSSTSDDSDDGLPGFGGAVAIVALCIATALTVGRRTDRR